MTMLVREVRFDSIRNRWLVISTERARRPSDYLMDDNCVNIDHDRIVSCPFCEGLEGKTPPEVFAIREPGSEPNSPGWQVRVIPNKYPALHVEDNARRYATGIFDVVSGAGAHEIIIESPNHNAGLADLEIERVRDVLLAFRERIKDLFRDPRLRYVLIFKNHGAQAGASIMHTHSQLIATPMVPPIVKQELTASREHYREKERCLICDLIHQELDYQTRIVFESANYIIWAPFASSFPFETWILPKRHLRNYSIMDDNELMDLAYVLKRNLLSIKNLLNDPPYNFVIHTSPSRFLRPGHPEHRDSIEYDFHWHLEIIPRLTTIAGFEWGAGLFINPTSPETAADYLREEIEVCLYNDLDKNWDKRRSLDI
jgi:UDPglucose--hexose-1-phosphate uridylyltransferase